MNNDRTEDGDKGDLGLCELHNLQDHLGHHGANNGAGLARKMVTLTVDLRIRLIRYA